MDDMPQGYNIGWDIVGNRCVTTGMFPRFITYGGGWMKTFETIIWHYDPISPSPDKRGGILHQIHHGTQAKAEKIHGQIVKSLGKENPNGQATGDKRDTRHNSR